MATTTRTSKLLILALRALCKLGRDVWDARCCCRIPVVVMAERASISCTTRSKVEKGEPGVFLGAYATVLFVLGLAERLGDLADPGTDELGLALEEERLLQRIWRPCKPAHGTPGGRQGE